MNYFTTFPNLGIFYHFPEALSGLSLTYNPKKERGMKEYPGRVSYAQMDENNMLIIKIGFKCIKGFMTMIELCTR